MSAAAEVCDLHTHSTASDGTFAPEAIPVLAKDCGLSAVALTDHNSVLGLSAFTRAAEAMGVMGVPGVELTTRPSKESAELHIVGLFLHPSQWDAMADFCAHYERIKREADRACVRRLREAGYAITEEEVFGGARGSTNRVHIARALMAHGYIQDLNSAMNGLLHERRGYYVKPERATPEQAIQLIHDCGGLAIWAHPLVSVSKPFLEPMLQALKKHGLDGVETRYHSYTPSDTQRMTTLAKKLNLLESGGSDFHGENKPKIALGCAQVPQSFCDAMLRRNLLGAKSV